MVLYILWGPRVVILFKFFSSSFLMKCWVEIDFWTLSVVADAEMKSHFLVGRVKNEIRVLLEICSQVGGLPWGTFYLSRFQNSS